MTLNLIPEKILMINTVAVSQTKTSRAIIRPTVGYRACSSNTDRELHTPLNFFAGCAGFFTVEKNTFQLVISTL